MSRLKQLQAKKEMKTIGGLEFEIEPLTVNELDLFLELESTDDIKVKAKAIRTILFKVIKQAEPEATDEEIESMDVKYLNDWVSAIMDVNGVEQPDANKQG